MKRAFLVLAALPLAVLPAAPAAAAPPSIYHTIKAATGYAELTQTVDCQRTTVWLTASTAMYASQPGPLNKQQTTDVLVRVEDACAEEGLVTAAAGGGGTILYEASGRAWVGPQVDPRLRRATVTATVQGEDGAASPVTIAVRGAWTGTGELEHTTIHTGDHSVEGNVSASDNNLRRDAVADVTITVSDASGTVLHVAGTTEAAHLELVKSHCIEVARPGVGEFYPCFGFPG